MKSWKNVAIMGMALLFLLALVAATVAPARASCQMTAEGVVIEG